MIWRESTSGTRLTVENTLREYGVLEKIKAIWRLEYTSHKKYDRGRTGNHDLTETDCGQGIGARAFTGSEYFWSEDNKKSMAGQKKPKI